MITMDEQVGEGVGEKGGGYLEGRKGGGDCSFEFLTSTKTEKKWNWNIEKFETADGCTF